MNDMEGFEFVSGYFEELFGKRNLDALDIWLDKKYFDDDIGDNDEDHIRNSKEYLQNMFRENPSIGVDVIKAITHDDVIAAFLEWYDMEGNIKRTLRKGVAMFVVKDGKIVKRHTYIYSS
jgi:predicted SnoaL-like aldol condensation-catalyzing enzyme